MPYSLNSFLSTITGKESPPPPWEELKFNPMGLYNLQQCLNILTKDCGLLNKYSNSFLASDIAWFVAGALDNSNHCVQPNAFHSWFQTSCKNIPISRIGNKIRNEGHSNLHQLTFDLVSLLHGSDMVLTDTKDRPQLGIAPMEGPP